MVMKNELVTSSPDPTVSILREFGRGLGLDLYRLILYGDDRGEAEFSAPDPTEVLVFKWTGNEELRDLLTVGDRRAAVFRKKCIKCMMHERPAG